MSVYEVFELLGGVALFLYGMNIMSSGLRSAAGDKMRDILEHVTSNRITAVLVGILVTILIQSSSATDMMVIGFVNSGLMNLTQAIGVIMGANIGTTITAQITAFNISAIAPAILFVGCIMYMFMKKPLYRYIGMVIMGFGMLFVGISMIKGVITPLSQTPWFASFILKLSNPLLAVLFGIVFTALLQSSSSSTVIFQTFAVQGILDYHTAVYLVIGAAIGSVTPNLLASLTTNRNGKRTAILNLIFNLYRAALLLLLITIFPQILTGIQALSPNDIARQIANTHTIFAIVAVAAGLPIMQYFVVIANKIIPVQEAEIRSEQEKQLLYMTDTAMPEVAIRQAMMEIHRMGELARNNLDTSVQAFLTKSEELSAQVEETEEIVDYLTKAITDKLVSMRSMVLSDRDVFRVSKLSLVVSNYERISDHAENIVEYLDKTERNHSVFSDEALKELQEITEATLASIDLGNEIFLNEDFSKLPQAEKLEQRVDELQEQMVANHVERLMRGECDALSGVVFADMCTDLERCSDHAINIATALVNGYTKIG